MTTSDLFRSYTQTEVAFYIMFITWSVEFIFFSSFFLIIVCRLSSFRFVPFTMLQSSSSLHSSTSSSLVVLVFGFGFGCNYSLVVQLPTFKSFSSSSLVLECLFFTLTTVGLLMISSVRLLWRWNACRWCFAGDDWSLSLPQKGLLFQIFTSCKT